MVPSLMNELSYLASLDYIASCIQKLHAVQRHREDGGGAESSQGGVIPFAL